MTTLKDAVAEKIAASGPTVEARVIEYLAEATIAKRVKQITDAFTEMDNLTKDLRRTKPDIIGYGEDGAVLSSSYSKGRIDERKRITDRLAKIERAIDKALERGEYGDLDGLGGNKKTTDTKDDSE